MDLQQLRYVVAVAELGNFTRAAERCFVVQSALSHQVAKLEQELGARLFHRTSRMVRLTPAGEAFLPSARQCLLAADRARAEVAAATGEVRGRLAVGVIPTVAAVDVPSSLRSFHTRYPGVRVGLTTGASDALVRRVADGRLDVAFLGLPADAVVDGVRSHVLATDHHVAVLAPGHRLAAEGRLTLPQLAGEVFVDFPAGTSAREQTDRAFASQGLVREVAFEVTDVHLMAALIREGLGVGLLPAAFAPRLSGVDTVVVSDAPARAEHVVFSRLDPTPPAAAFLELLGLGNLLARRAAR
ncbi:LysR family transcriptional regulator [Nocardioides sp. MAHUQ-72]|uniref:LysR family transcriptional regulator n=1 Tax=unclassified Nocardioides TaxID=2615069 RepID=UPI00361BDDBF